MPGTVLCRLVENFHARIDRGEATRLPRASSKIVCFELSGQGGDPVRADLAQPLLSPECRRHLDAGQLRDRKRLRAEYDVSTFFVRV